MFGGEVVGGEGSSYLLETIVMGRHTENRLPEADACTGYFRYMASSKILGEETGRGGAAAETAQEEKYGDVDNSRDEEGGAGEGRKS